MEAEPSRTAMFAAVFRGQHRMEETPPWVLDDPFALVLVGPLWRQLAEMGEALIPKGELRREVRAAVVVRARYAEEHLSDGRFPQCVILGAGLDSLAWRRPDLCAIGPLFEVDHPASQAWKRQRMEEGAARE